MALVVEDGTGKTDAESYETVDAADTYLEKWEDPPPAIWFGTKAVGSLSLEVIPTDTETVTIGTKVYTFKDVIGADDGHVFIGASVAASRTNLLAAVNLSGTAGTTYGSGTTEHPDVEGLSIEGAVLFFGAKLYGDIGNGIATTETLAGTGNEWGAATLASGADPTLDDSAKERHLRLATQRIDVEGGENWKGAKLIYNQALAHPKIDVYDSEGNWIEYSPLPAVLRRSTSLLALASANGDDLYPDLTDSGSLKSKTIRIEGAVTIKKDWTGAGNPPTKEYSLAMALLAPLLDASDRVYRA